MDDTRVLVAVRNPLAAEAVQSIMEIGGFEVVDRVTLGHEVAARAAELRPDIVLLDWQILKIDADIVERLRDASPLSKIVVLSEDEQSARAARRQGVTAVISKDASAEMLLERVSRIAAGDFGETKSIAASIISLPPCAVDPVEGLYSKSSPSRRLAKVVNVVVAVVVPLALLALNSWAVWPLFLGGYTRFTGSIESAFITDARFILENGLFVTWNPLWYFGFPFHLFYTPLLPYLVSVLPTLDSSITVPSSYRIVSAAFYVAGPATLFFFVRYLTGRNLTAIIASAGYSVLPSFVYLMPSLMGDAAEFSFAPWQLVVMVKYGEGPHITALTLTPLAALFFLRALRRGRLRDYFLAALPIALVALINWIALFALVVILAAIALSQALVSPALTALARAASCSLLAFAMVAFWYNPGFIKASLAFGGGGGFLDDAPKLLIVLVIVSYALAVLLSKNPAKQAVVIVGLWFGAFAVIVGCGQYLGIRLAPQPIRYTNELSMGAVMALGLAVTRAYDLLRLRPGLLRVVLPGLLLLMVGIVFTGASVGFLTKGWALLRPSADFSATSEQQVARWLAANGEGDRAYLTGSHAFWLNAETDVPQLRGGTDQGATNHGGLTFRIRSIPDLTGI